jgi:uncharacterized OB-fold protein
MTMGTPLNDTAGVHRKLRRLPFSAPYWEATREKRVVIQYCKATGQYQHYPRPVSVYTGRRRDIEWREVSGKGEVFSWQVAHRGTPAFRGHEPYAVVLVTLDEGVNVMANMVHCTREELRVGMRVRPWWLPLEDGTHLLMFEPDPATTA